MEYGSSPTLTPSLSSSGSMRWTFRSGRSRGLKNVVATALFMNREPIREWCKVTDAFAVALKGFDDEFYRKVVGAPLKPILDAIVTVKSEGVWLELVTLIVPTLNDNMKQIREMCLWVRRNLGAQVPCTLVGLCPNTNSATCRERPSKLWSSVATSLWMSDCNSSTSSM